MHRFPHAFPKSDQNPDYVAAAKWIMENGPPGPVSIMAAKPHASFYCNAQPVDYRSWRLQDIKIDKLKEALSDARPTYFIYDDSYSLREVSSVFRASSKPQPASRNAKVCS
jgi:hypothetical protein